MLGLLAGALGMAIYGLAPTGPLFWLGVPVMALWGLAGPAIRSMMSRLVSPSEQGQLQGANSRSRSIAGADRAGPLHRRPSPLLGLPAGRAFDLAAADPAGRPRRRLGGYAEPPAGVRPRVSLQTSQSGFSGLLNHGSAQPRSRQTRTTSGAIAWPSRSNSGSLPPAWASPRRR